MDNIKNKINFINYNKLTLYKKNIKNEHSKHDINNEDIKDIKYDT